MTRMTHRKIFDPEAIIDPTNNDLRLAILDQHIAGQFRKHPYAYAAVCLDEGGFGLGIAELDQPGFTPIPGGIFKADSYEAASDTAAGMNKHIGLEPWAAVKIVASSMTGIRRGLNY